MYFIILKYYNTYELLSSLAPCGYTERNSWIFNKERGTWASLFDKTFASILKDVTNQRLLNPPKEEKDINTSLVQSVPVIKEHEHFVYGLISKSNLYKKDPEPEAGVVDVKAFFTEKEVSSVDEPLPALSDKKKSEDKPRRGRKPGQKDTKPRVRRTKKEIQEC